MTTPRKRATSESILKVRAPLKERYQKAVDYQLYRLIHNSQWYDDDITSEMQKVHKKVAVQMKDQALNGKDSIYVINVLTELKQAYESSRIHEDATD